MAICVGEKRGFTILKGVLYLIFILYAVSEKYVDIF